MIYDRPYMRTTWQPGMRSALHWIIGINIACFVLQAMSLTWGGSNWMEGLFGLSITHLTSGYLWTVVTYSFLHSPSFLLHILFNMLIIFFMGRALEDHLNRSGFLFLYFSAVICGALAWLAVQLVVSSPPGSLLIGASAGALGLLLYFCLLQPDRPLTFLLFFVIPISLRPKWIIAFIVGIDLFGLLFFELPDNRHIFGVAHSAHLGGMLAAWAFYRLSLRGSHSSVARRTVGGQPASFLKPRNSPRGAAPSGKFTLKMSNRKDLQAELDRILDKINDKGFGSLTEEERETLDKAKEILR